MSALEHEIAQRLNAHTVLASATQVARFADYISVLRRWNARINLTALESGDAALDRLIVEPALAATFIDSQATHLVDIGSGGGSPAIPLKIMRPDLQLTMIESRARKSVFLREVARHLELSATSVETAKFEDVLSDGRAEPIDVISARAVRLDPPDVDLLAGALTDSGQVLWFLSASQATSSNLPPSFQLEVQAPLLESASSELLVLRRRNTQQS